MEPRQRILRVALIVVAVGLLIYFYIKVSTFLFSIIAFKVITGKIKAVTGWDIWFVRAVSAFLIALLLIPVVYSMRLMFSIRSKRRLVGTPLFLLILGFVFLGSHFLASSVFYSTTTGKPVKYAAITPEGKVEFSDSPGYHPKWGVKFRSVNPIFQLMESFEPEEILFDQNGRPLKKYSCIRGEYRLFDRSLEFDPTYGVKLKDLTPEAARNYFRQKERAKRAAVQMRSKEASVVQKIIEPVLFSDDFETGIKKEWHEPKGDWVMLNHQLTVSAPKWGNWYRLFVGSPAWTNYQVEMIARFGIERSLMTEVFEPNRGQIKIGMHLRRKGGNYIFFYVGGNARTIDYVGWGVYSQEKRVRGGIKKVHFETTLGGPFTLSATASSNLFSFYVNGQEVWSFNDNYHLAGGVGIYAGSDQPDVLPGAQKIAATAFSIDDFKVTALTQ